jgi:hypothetical protein
LDMLSATKGVGSADRTFCRARSAAEGPVRNRVPQ